MLKYFKRLLFWSDNPIIAKLAIELGGHLTCKSIDHLPLCHEKSPLVLNLQNYDDSDDDGVRQSNCAKIIL